MSKTLRGVLLSLLYIFLEIASQNFLFAQQLETTKVSFTETTKTLNSKTNPINQQKQIPIPTFSSYWINAKGQSQAKSKILNAQWVWSKETSNSSIETPALVLKIENPFPKDWNPQFSSSDGAKITYPLTKDSNYFEIEIRTSNPTIRYIVIDSKGNELELTFVLQSNSPTTIVHNSTACEKIGHFLEATENKSHSLFLIMQCKEYFDHIEYTLYKSTEFKWSENGELKERDPKNEYNFIEFKNIKSQEANVYTKTLLTDSIKDDTGGNVKFQIRFVPKIPPKRLTASAGIGPSYYQYSETPTKRAGLKLTQMSLTGKVNVGYKLIPKVLDVAFNMFGNVITLVHTPASYNGYALNPARFYGINGRLGYRLPTKLGATEFYFLTGWYFWGMIVSASNAKAAYGIESLTGPQLFFMVNHMPKDKVGYWAYFKFALIADQLSISNTSNSEIAFGCGVQLTPKNPKPVSLTLDISKAHFSNKGYAVPSTTGNEMSLMSYTLGLQKVIF